jgi:flagellar biosynthetic protein FliO
VNIFVATLLVLGLVSALAWLVRRGPLAQLASKGKAVAVETAIPLGERRSLVIVAVEGRRLLLGMTPTSISLVTELRAVGPKGGPHVPDGGPESFFEAGR